MGSSAESAANQLLENFINDLKKSGESDTEIARLIEKIASEPVKAGGVDDE